MEKRNQDWWWKNIFLLVEKNDWSMKEKSFSYNLGPPHLQKH